MRAELALPLHVVFAVPVENSIPTALLGSSAGFVGWFMSLVAPSHNRESGRTRFTPLGGGKSCCWHQLGVDWRRPSVAEPRSATAF